MLLCKVIISEWIVKLSESLLFDPCGQVGLQHKINDDIMIYPGYMPRPGIEPLILHYGLPFKVGNWSFSKLEHHEDEIVYDCNRLFPPPPFPREVNNLPCHMKDVLSMI
jgi:hypothetical protein